jgi:Protein of unknown function (DUF2946)
MRQQQIRAFRVARWLALLGVLVNVWVLTLHTTSQALAGLGAPDVHCSGHESGHNHHGHQPAPGKPSTCPICSGLAALHLAVPAPETLLALPESAEADVPEMRASAVCGQRLIRVGNRGPPVLL